MATPQREFKAAYGYNTRQNSDASIITNTDPSLTVQSQAEDADINVIMHRFGITGKMPENPRIPSYGDFSEVLDYRSALEAVRNADEAFMEIPAKIRAQFDNDPQKFMDYCANPENLVELRRLGLTKETQEQYDARINQAATRAPQATASVTAGDGSPAPTSTSGGVPNDNGPRQ